MRYSWIKRQRGFTLIELLVVIAIIAILAAILFPVFAQAREKARQTACVSNEKQMALGVLQYIQDYDEIYPMSQEGFYTNPPGIDTWANTWVVQIQPYVKSYDVFRCPDDSVSTAVPGGNGPGCGGWEGIAVSYDVNANAVCCWKQTGPFGGGGSPLNGSTFWEIPSLTDGQIVQPADSVLLTERFNSDDSKVGVENCTGYNSSFREIPSWGSIDLAFAPNGTLPPNAYPYGPNGAVSAHHTGRADFAFCDGHVKSMVPAETNPDPVNQPQNDMWNCLRPNYLM
jgi:prepilin-type N-terminal cleavage/methylation domain-containing protein/prepilin-type processing-associated H-X9-DG protein